MGKASSIESDIEGFGKLLHRIGLARDRFLDRAGLDAERLRVLARMFNLPGKVLLRPGDSHLLQSDGSLSYLPHDQAAVVPFTSLFAPTTTLETDSPINELLAVNDSLICSGSPVSSSFARAYIPSHSVLPEKPRVDTKLNAARLPYHFLYRSPESSVFVVSGMERGRAVRKRLNGLVLPQEAASYRTWFPSSSTDDHGWLRTDYLLVSRLPRNPFGGEVLLLSGGHGAGTQAAELLFAASGLDLEALSALEKALGGAKYYQFVLEVSDFVHEAPMSIAHSVRVSTECPPLRLELTNDLFVQA